MTHPDVIGLPPQLSLGTCIQATQNPGESLNYLLACIAAAYGGNLDRPLTLSEGEIFGLYCR